MYIGFCRVKSKKKLTILEALDLLYVVAVELKGYDGSDY